ncbi:CGNR zinc finger domain-containing protein [Streptomyces iconiensis]|uniref:CGNR zinc finger domain-containing protein n=1 Tax=Streptomyces iconiensis TaxID=1384038 RepID=A0ABT7A2G9_9ACTN|nr:CGNR zinc finger domain-containing protein [Streptomyces iconiensis]MDJ1135530.1 CGNR zinc finger domain-containing protein [Streptomyces iconiensis]
MELNYYSDMAVRLVNTEEPERGEDSLTSVDAVRELCGANVTMARKATEADVTRLRGVRTRLRAVFSAAAEGDAVRAVDLLNSLLMEFPTSPQISGHEVLDDAGRPRWHMHLAEHPANATAGYAATACMGLAFHLTDLGVDRLGVCQATPCRNAYLDTSTNRSRRYCSDRCATRANVAAYRARKRLETLDKEAEEPGGSPAASPRGRTGPIKGRTAATDQRATEDSER